MRRSSSTAPAPPHDLLLADFCIVALVKRVKVDLRTCGVSASSGPWHRHHWQVLRLPDLGIELVLESIHELLGTRSRPLPLPHPDALEQRQGDS
eukprot:758708-Hanusia_phi.AAC.2